jgi:hypothetical protein
VACTDLVPLDCVPDSSTRKRLFNGLHYGPTRKNLTPVAKGMLVGFCVPTVDQVAPGPIAGLDWRLPCEGVHAMTILLLTALADRATNGRPTGAKLKP